MVEPELSCHGLGRNSAGRNLGGARHSWDGAGLGCDELELEVCLLPFHPCVLVQAAWVAYGLALCFAGAGLGWAGYGVG